MCGGGWGHSKHIKHAAADTKEGAGVEAGGHASCWHLKTVRGVTIPSLFPLPYPLNSKNIGRGRRCVGRYELGKGKGYSKKANDKLNLLVLILRPTSTHTQTYSDLIVLRPQTSSTDYLFSVLF